jgi:2-polyprenyl-3-methyl-5-hydroxy-6-metoxy-1,4-benzoquinol methylase
MKSAPLFEFLQEVSRRPDPFSEHTARDLWNDPHIAERMLAYHLDSAVDVASRNHDFISRSAEWIVPHFELASGACVVDFGCGPGLYAERLSRLGLKVTGIDFSSNSIRYARERCEREGLDIEYIEADYLELATDRRFDLVMMIMCDFCALSPRQRTTMLEKFRSMLAPGGAILLDVYGARTFEQQEESIIYAPNLMDGFWSDAEYFAFKQTFKYEDMRLFLDKYTIVESARTRRIYNWLQCFTPQSLENELAEHGLQMTEYLGNVAGDSYDPEATEFAAVAVLGSP